MTIQPATTVLKLQLPLPSTPIEQTDWRSGQQPVSSGVKSDARATELPDEDVASSNKLKEQLMQKR